MRACVGIKSNIENKGVSMGQDDNVLNNVDKELIHEYQNKSIKHQITTKLEFYINIAGSDFSDIEEAIDHAYRCGLATMASHSKKTREEGLVDQDELYKVLKNTHSLEHKADFLREIAREWFPIELHNEKKIKTVNMELNELADFLEK